MNVKIRKLYILAVFNFRLDCTCTCQMLGPVATAAWLFWLAVFVTKMSAAILMESRPDFDGAGVNKSHARVVARKLSPLLARSLVLTAGVAGARLVADGCTKAVTIASVAVGGAGVLAIAADVSTIVIFKQYRFMSRRPGHAIIAASALCAAIEALQRAPATCRPDGRGHKSCNIRGNRPG